MRDIKSDKPILELGGNKYELELTLNVVSEIQRRYGDVVIDDENVESVKWLLATLVNEAVDIYNDEHSDKKEYVTEKQIGRMLKAKDLERTQNLVRRVYISSFAESETADPNAQTTRQE